MSYVIIYEDRYTKVHHEKVFPRLAEAVVEVQKILFNSYCVESITILNTDFSV